jgi:hypothetical protein
MSDFKTKRLKKKNDLEKALQSMPQDLYNWKPMKKSVNSLKSKNQQSHFAEHRFNSFDLSSGTTFNIDSSEKDFNKSKTNGKHLNTSTRLRPLSSDSFTLNNFNKFGKNQKQDNSSDVRVVDLENLESLRVETQISSELHDLEIQKFYLQILPKKTDTNNHKTIEQIEEGLVIDLFQIRIIIIYK